eukprot:4031822-Pyramimonas_sp.AAC.1
MQDRVSLGVVRSTVLPRSRSFLEVKESHRGLRALGAPSRNLSSRGSALEAQLEANKAGAAQNGAAMVVDDGADGGLGGAADEAERAEARLAVVSQEWVLLGKAWAYIFPRLRPV